MFVSQRARHPQRHRLPLSMHLARHSTLSSVHLFSSSPSIGLHNPIPPNPVPNSCCPTRLTLLMFPVSLLSRSLDASKPCLDYSAAPLHKRPRLGPGTSSACYKAPRLLPLHRKKAHFLFPRSPHPFVWLLSLQLEGSLPLSLREHRSPHRHSYAPPLQPHLPPAHLSFQPPLLINELSTQRQSPWEATSSSSTRTLKPFISPCI
jgi:hypothetical protein